MFQRPNDKKKWYSRIQKLNSFINKGYTIQYMIRWILLQANGNFGYLSFDLDE